MLVPQFSIRGLLLVTTAVACACLIVSLAFQGHFWAIGMTAGMLTAVVAILIQAFVFFLVWLCSLLGRIRIGRPAERSNLSPSP